MLRFRLAAPALVALAVAVHAPTLGHRFLFDDGVQIVSNRAVTAGAPLGAYFFDRDTTSNRAEYNTRIYRPLRNLAFRAVVVVAGVRPLAFGLANLAAYAAATLLLLSLLRRLVTDERAAVWATALWVVLPVHVEPVAYYSALGDLLSLALELGALVVALPLFSDGKRWRLAASTALAAASMLTKEMAVTEPAMLVLVALIVCGGDGWRAPALRRLVALHTLVAVAYLALRTAVVGAMGQEPITAATMREGLRDAPWLLAHYLWISVAPLGHAAAYRVAPPSTLALVVTIAALAATASVAWRWRRTVAVGLLWFALSLAPVLHLVPLWADLADRFALFPTVGLALALAAAIAPVRRGAVFALAVLLVVYAAASVIEARAWRSGSLLWRYAVDRQPAAPLGHNNLAAVLLREGRIEDASHELDQLHALGFTRPDVEVLGAYISSRLGRGDEAARAIALALRLDPSNGVAHAVAGQLALAAGDIDRAAREHAEARRLAPNHPSTGLLGHLLIGVHDDARVDYLRALQALSFDDADGAERAARDCLRRSPERTQCASALGQARVMQAPLDDESRALLERCIATPSDGERQHCREALWNAR
ncbi:MAG: hypothetical protein JWM53_6618 [bacterium]|nr:hypothetical protein [bacterium]